MVRSNEHEIKPVTEPTWRRRDLDRKRLERACAKLIAEAVSDGNVQLIRSHRIRLAALRFAFEGSVEAHQQLSAFKFDDRRPLDDGNLRSILTIVEEARRAGWCGSRRGESFIGRRKGISLPRVGLTNGAPERCSVCA